MCKRMALKDLKESQVSDEKLLRKRSVIRPSGGLRGGGGGGGGEAG